MSEPEPEPDSSSAASAGGLAILRRFCSLLVLVSLGALFASPLWAAPEASDLASHGPERAPVALIIVFLSLLLMSGLVSGSETAIFSLNKVDVLRVRKKHSASSRALLYLLDRPNDTLTTILVLNNFVNVGLALTAGALTESLFAGQPAAGFVAAAFGATTMILVFGEVVPKSVAHVKAPLLAGLAAWPTALAASLLTPIRRAMNPFIGWVFRRLNVPESTMTDRVSEEELKAMIAAREISTLLEEDEREMIHGVFELGDTYAEEIMIPRTEVSSLRDTLTQDEMHQRLRELVHSRVLIFEDDLDHLTGFVLAKEVLLNPDTFWKEFLRDLLYVPERIRLVDLLDRFRRNSAKIAVLVDEYGVMAGLVTLHDLLEEIVGDMAERHEQVVEDCERLEPGRWRVQGQMKLSDLGREISVAFPEDAASTVGGFLMNMLGRIPTTGSELRYDGLAMKVTRMVGRRIIQIEVEQVKPEEKAEAASPSGDPPP